MTMKFKPASENYPRQIIFDSEARKKFLEGMEICKKAIGSTMGPCGRTVVYDAWKQVYPGITKDGVTVAEQIYLEDIFANKGALMVKQAAREQVRATGDGTTLTTIFIYEIFKRGLKAVENGVNVSDFIKGIDNMVNRVCAHIKKNAMRCDRLQDMQMVATIACNSDTKLGNMIAEAQNRIGADGEIIIAHSKTRDQNHKLMYNDGYEFNYGIDHKEFLTSDKGIMYVENPLVLIIDTYVGLGSEIQAVVGCIENQICRGQHPSEWPPLVVFSDGIKMEALAIMLNSQETKYRIYNIKINAETAAQREYILRDIAAITKAVYIDKKKGLDLMRIKPEHFGRCKNIVSLFRKQTRILTNNEGNNEYELRLATLKNIIDTVDDEMDKELARSSIANLKNAVATLEIAGQNETEIWERIHRADDACNALKSAIEEGIVPGGGVACLFAKKELKVVGKNHDTELGEKTILDILECPIRQILENANHCADLIIEKILNDNAIAYDVKTGMALEDLGKTDMFDLKIVDPAKVICTALQNAASLACLLLNSSTIIATPLLLDNK